jgi:hypothetical protein
MPNRRGIIVGEEVNDGFFFTATRRKEKKWRSFCFENFICTTGKCVFVYVIDRNQLIGILAVAGGT